MIPYPNNITRVTLPCPSCGAARGLRWHTDAWVCGQCGDEFYPDETPPQGATLLCGRCNRLVTLTRTATTSHLSTPPNTPVLEWVDPSAPNRRLCPVSDGHPFTPHQPDGYESRYYA